MTIGEQIQKLRKQNSLSQEAIAEKLNVSRQAVSKWETGLSNPDTENLIRLSELFGVSVEELASGQLQSNFSNKANTERKPHKSRKKIITWITGASVLLIILVGTLFIHFVPVKWDALACSGGYATAIFDKYNGSLIEKYIDGSDRDEYILSAEAVRGTQEAEWDGRWITLYFDISYQDSELGEVTERIHFMGKRIWIDTFRWGGAMIASN